MSDADTPAEATETQDAPQEEQSPDALTSRMDEIQSGFSSLQGDVRQLLEQRQEPEEEDDDEYGDFLTDEEGNFYDPQTGREIDRQELERRERERFQNEIIERVRAEYAPLQEYQAEQQARDLQTRYPELQKAEVANEVFQEAQQAAAAYGNPALAQNARFLEQTYLARMARQQAETQEPSEAADATLEGAGAQVPAEGDDDMMDRVAEAHASKGASFWDS